MAVDLEALGLEERALYEEAAATPNAVWGRCPKHPGCPTAPYDRRHCCFGCPVPESLDELVVRTAPSLRGGLIDLLPDRADELIELLLKTGDLVRS